MSNANNGKDIGEGPKALATTEPKSPTKGRVSGTWEASGGGAQTYIRPGGMAILTREDKRMTATKGEVPAAGGPVQAGETTFPRYPPLKNVDFSIFQIVGWRSLL